MKYYAVRVFGKKKSIPLPDEVNEHVVYTCEITEEEKIILTPIDPLDKK
jgi:hypothetical protein